MAVRPGASGPADDELTGACRLVQTVGDDSAFQHVGTARRATLRLVGRERGHRSDEVERTQPHRLHRPGGGSDVAGMLRFDEHDPDVSQAHVGPAHVQVTRGPGAYHRSGHGEKLGA